MKNKKIYVEFFGLWGSGKTTICSALAKKLEEEGVDVIFQKKEFMKHGNIYRHVYPVIHTILKSWFDFFDFLFYIRANFKNGKLNMLTYFFLHKFFMDSYSKNKVLLSDQGIIDLANPYELNSKKLKKILGFYHRGRKMFFVFVNVSNPRIIFKRRLEREGDKLKKMKIKELNSYKKKLNEQAFNKKFFNKEKLFYLLGRERENVIIKRVIKIDGENPIEENIKFLKKQLNEDINV